MFLKVRYILSWDFHSNTELRNVSVREISSVLCDHLEGWDREGGREMQEGGDMGIYVHIQLIHVVVQQQLTHHCEAIILQ